MNFFFYTNCGKKGKYSYEYPDHYLHDFNFYTIVFMTWDSIIFPLIFQILLTNFLLSLAASPANMASSADKLFVLGGLLVLAHAAYSAAQHRGYLRLTEQEFTTLPLDILLQSLAALILTCYGIVRVVGDFKEIKASAELERKTWETLCNRSSFYTFDHRGKALFG